MDSLVLRIIYTVLIVLVFAASFTFRYRASRAGDTLDRKREGLAILIARTVVGLGLLAYLGFMMVAPDLVPWSRLGLPVWVRYTGAGLAALVSPLVLWMFKSLGKNITDTVSTRKDHTLVTTGIYRWIRHPLYTLGAVFFLCLGLCADSWVFMAMAVASFLVIGIVRTRKEEEELERRFGDEYRAWRDRTGKYFPRLWQKRRD